MTLSRVDYNNLFRYGVALAGNEDDAFELLHQAIENYMRSQLNAIPGNEIQNPPAYVRRSMRNLYIDQMRHQKRFHHIEYEACELDPAFDIQSASLEDILITKQEFEQCWELLNIYERDTLYLFAVEGYTVQEIADEQGLNRATLLSRIHRIKLRVKKQLGLKNQVKRV